jgi:hypothetical protein
MTQTSIREPVDAARMAEAETLLSRYPNVDPGEAARILRFMRQAPAIEVALLTCKDHLKAPIERFRDDHRDHFELNWRRIARIWGPVGLVLTALALGWLLLG